MIGQFVTCSPLSIGIHIWKLFGRRKKARSPNITDL